MRLIALPVNKAQLGWIIGKKGAQIKEMQAETGVSSIQVESEPDRVVLRGSRESVELARLYLECHISIFEDRTETERDIKVKRSELEKMPLIRGAPIPGVRRQASPGRKRKKAINIPSPKATKA